MDSDWQFFSFINHCFGFYACADDSSRQLSDAQVKIIRSNRNEVHSCLNVDNEFIAEMRAAGIITDRQRNHLQELSESKRSSWLLDWLTRTSVAIFKKFISCLEKTNQSHVATLLTVASSTYTNEEHLHTVLLLTLVIVQIDRNVT
jgi:hypothetical protein